MNAWFRQHQGKLQFALRMTLAALASYGLGEQLGLAQSYWAVLSAVIVSQGSVGGSLKAGINRLIGTIGGAVWGAIIALLIPHGTPKMLFLALIAAIAPLAVLTAFRPDYRVAPITAIIVLMGASLQPVDPLSSAVSRVFEIGIGSAVAIAVALFIFPARAHRLLARSGSAVVASMADLASLLAVKAGGGANAESLQAIQVRLRTGIAQTENRAEEAKVERANRLSDGPNPEPLARTLRRLRHDLTMLARALSMPLSAPVREHLEHALTSLFDELASWFTLTSNALAAGDSPPDLNRVRTLIDEYRIAVSREHDEMAHKTGNDDIQRVFAILFLFEQMIQNLQDLSDRTMELASGEKASDNAAGA